MAFQSLRVWQLRPILGGATKRVPEPSRSETSMPPRPKINFGLSGMYMQIFMPLSQSAQISCLSTTLLIKKINVCDFRR